MEKDRTFNRSFETEPWECGWASEGLWLLKVSDLTGTLEVTSEVSPDGSDWGPSQYSLTIFENGLHSLAARDLGPWTRLRATLSGEHASVHLFLYLSLKG